MNSLNPNYTGAQKLFPLVESENGVGGKSIFKNAGGRKKSQD